MDKTVFTNGCFDVLHPGHIDLLARARALGSRLVVGINSDESVRRIKGPDRPIFTQDQRRAMLLALASVDEVHIFEELTPERLIKDLKPHVLVKGGDWPVTEIIGADLVIESGGEVHSLPLVDGFSSSDVISRLSKNGGAVPQTESVGIITGSLDEHSDVVRRTSDLIHGEIEKCGRLIAETVQNGNKVLICGNGGSAADAQHIAAELAGRFEKERSAYAGIALTTDTSALTAISNDYGFERVFARQVEALAREGDLIIAISTSGVSPNIIAAVMEARRRGCKVIGMTGASGKKLAALSDLCIMVPSERTARIQELHITIAHIWCEMIDDSITGAGK